MQLNKDDTLAWSLYWSENRLHSCVAADDDADQQVLNKIWAELAERLTDNAKVLDLATGNGAVPAALLAARPSLLIDAVDEADIDPLQYLDGHPELESVSFFGNSDIRELDLSGQQYDAITSQFGIEYAGLMECAETALKHLLPGGIFSFLVHHVDSEVIASSRQKMHEMQVLLAPQGLMQTLLNVLRGSVPFAALETLGQEYLAADSPKTQAVSGQVFSAIEQIAEVLERDFAQARKLGVTLNLRITAEFDRLTQMTAAAHSAEQMQNWISQISAAGFTVANHHPVYVDQSKQAYLLGWLVQGQRNK